jgi:hypothetical protein
VRSPRGETKNLPTEKRGRLVQNTALEVNKEDVRNATSVSRVAKREKCLSRTRHAKIRWFLQAGQKRARDGCDGEKALLQQARVEAEESDAVVRVA